MDKVMLLSNFFIAYITKSEKRLLKVYKDTLKKQESYLESCRNPIEKKHKIEELIFELIEIINLGSFQKNCLKINEKFIFSGIKVKEKILGHEYVELWIRGKNLWIYYMTRDSEGVLERITPLFYKNQWNISREDVYRWLKDVIA